MSAGPRIHLDFTATWWEVQPLEVSKDKIFRRSSVSLQTSASNWSPVSWSVLTVSPMDRDGAAAEHRAWFTVETELCREDCCSHYIHELISISLLLWFISFSITLKMSLWFILWVWINMYQHAEIHWSDNFSLTKVSVHSQQARLLPVTIRCNKSESGSLLLDFLSIKYQDTAQVTSVLIKLLNVTPHYTALCPLWAVTSRSGSFTVKLQILCGTCTLMLMTLGALVSSAVVLCPE